MKSKNILLLLTPKNETVFLSENATLKETLKTFCETGTEAIPVVDDKGKYVGIVRKSSILWSIGENERNESGKSPVDIKHIIKRDFPCANASLQVHEVIGQLGRHSILPVIDDREMFIGIIERASLLKTA